MTFDFSFKFQMLFFFIWIFTAHISSHLFSEGLLQHVSDNHLLLCVNNIMSLCVNFQFLFCLFLWKKNLVSFLVWLVIKPHGDNTSLSWCLAIISKEAISPSQTWEISFLTFQFLDMKVDLFEEALRRKEGKDLIHTMEFYPLYLTIS